ncbi:hypothetical protein FW778_14495 [Ginsengibacter hankyongi]|uniref:Uncharacterized protein n=1 Tax=Ginsengibacter hankyongi TaxID=2607284 RepID=A0A5J5II69_9BACT|nr:hypothetical protein [Ginsengibacter hankyongi]KAA9038750.1 hypothetical protein FW778_14495 [Ginsengibacter hankyongi]
MENFTLTPKQYDDLKHIFMVDNADIGQHPEYFEEANVSPKDYLDERIALCEAFKIDFWESAGDLSRHYDHERLKAMYIGMSIEEFDKQYKIAYPNGIAEKVFRSLANNDGEFKNDDF